MVMMKRIRPNKTRQTVFKGKIKISKKRPVILWTPQDSSHETGTFQNLHTKTALGILFWAEHTVRFPERDPNTRL